MNRYSHMDRPKPRRRNTGNLLTMVGVSIAVAGVSIVAGTVYFGSQQTVSCTVDSKDRSVKFSTSSEGNSTSSTSYRVYTTDCGVFSVEDNIFLGKWNSSDTYGQLQDGKRYEMDIIGFRNGFLSIYPNILEARKTS